MSAGFSPGPWTVPHFARPKIGCECGYVLCDTGIMGAVATVHASGESDGTWANGDNPRFEEAKANAHLIAAAPDLFEALESLIPGRLCGENWNLSDSEHVPIDITLGELRAARTALAKARGEAK